MVQTMTRGRWRRAVAIRLPANAAADAAAHLVSVSCPAVGQCVAVGGYNTKALDGKVMAVSENKGRWGRAVAVALPANAAAQPLALLNSVSCVRKVYCETAGVYVTKSGAQAGFAETETRGRWHTAVQITSLPAGAQTSPSSVDLSGISCLPAECLVAGSYADKAGGTVPMVVLGSGRTWNRAVPVRLPRGAAARAQQTAELLAVTCYPAGRDCTGAGEYVLAAGVSEALAAAGGL